MSKIANSVYTVLKELFPQENIIEEHYVYYNGTRLFFDFFLKSYNILIEVQGEQHLKYCKFFHGSVESFKAQKYRDNLKVIYVEENYPLTLVLFYDKIDIITKDLVINRIHEAQQEA